MISVITGLAHGGLLAIVSCAMALGALRHNPRLFLKHFPDHVRAAQPPLTRQEKTAGYLILGPMVLLLAGGPVWSTLAVAGDGRASLDPASLWLHAFIVGMVANAADWLIVDELWLGLGKPRWALPSGVTLDDVMPFDHFRHFMDFLKGAVFFAIVAAIAAGVSIGVSALGLLPGGER